MKHLKLFETIETFNANKNSIKRPFVVNCIDGGIIYSSSIDSKEPRTVKVLYKTDIDSYSDEIDYEDWFQYYGIEEWDGESYYKWQKVESGSPIDYYILTSTDDFSDISLNNPYKPNGYISNDEINEGEYHNDYIVATGEKEFVDINFDASNLTAGEVVDLGLPSGLKWASCNIGADKPCDYGLLFQFGCVDGYEYNDINHKFQPSDSIPTTTSGKTYAKGDVLDPEDDAAYHATDGKLRMPTVVEIDELLSNTEHRMCIVNGVYGILFMGSNGNKIFIPAAGYFYGSFYYAGSYGGVWSSSVYSGGAFYAYRLDFNSDYCRRNSIDRYYGYSVRGVCKK